MHVARYHLLQGGNDLELARKYMEKVAASNAEEVREATDLLKKILQLVKQRAEENAASSRADDSSVGTSSTASTQSRS